MKKETEPFALISSTTIRLSKQVAHFADGAKVMIGLLDDRYIIIQQTKKDKAEKAKTTKQGESTIKCPGIIQVILQRKAIKMETRYLKYAAGYDLKKKAVVIDLEAPVSMAGKKKK